MKHARGVVVLTGIVSACLALNATQLFAPPIQPILSINAHLGDTNFTPGIGEFNLGQITINETLPVTVETAIGQTTLSLQFQMTADLFSDLSSGGHADGLFTNGSILIALSSPTDPTITYFEADNLTLRLEEPFDDIGLLGGAGSFDVIGGIWAPYFGDNGTETGQISQITFRITPSNLDNFETGFAGLSDITLTPETGGGDVPEPGTLLLLGTGVLGAFGWLRRSRTR